MLCKAQVVSVNTILAPNASGDSSIYDIISINDGLFLMAGKQGFVSCIDSNNTIRSVASPTFNMSLLKAENLGQQQIALGSTSGMLLLIDSALAVCQVKQIHHFKYACFYDLLKLNDSCLLIAGGNKKLINARKKLPRGFIIVTYDNGETWKYIYRNPFRMVWDIDADGENILYAASYSPFNTKILEFSGFRKKTLIKLKSLIHSIAINPGDTSIMLAGAKSHRDRTNASLMRIYNNEVIPIETQANAGTLWDIKHIDGYYIACGSQGMIYIIGSDGNFTPFETKTKENLYCLVAINNKSFYAVGSNQTIIKVEFNNAP
jgi:hypothetical protein